MAKNFINVAGLTYAGEEAEEIFVKNLYSSDLKGMGVRMLPGVKGKKKLVTGEVGDMFQAYTCPFSPAGSAKLSEQTIEPVEIKVNLENCYSDFWDTFMVKQTEISLNGGIPQAFQDWFFNDVLVKELNKEYEELWFNGDTEYTGDTKTYLKLGDGIVKKLDKAEGTVKVVGTKLTAANILAEIGKVAAQVDELENDVEGYKLFVNYQDYRKVLTALGANSPETIDVWANFTKVGDKVYAYGMEIVPSRIDKSVMIASHPENLVLGYDVADSEVSYKIVDMRESTLDNTFRVAVIANIAAGVIYPETAVLYKAA